MQVFVGGTFATAARSTPVWQYRQSMPSSPAWCLWLNWTGCSRATDTWVTYDERLMAAKSQSAPPTAKTAPKMLIRDSVFVLRLKICGMQRRRV